MSKLDKSAKATIKNLISLGTDVWCNGSNGQCPIASSGRTLVSIKRKFTLTPEEATRLRQAIIDKHNEFEKTAKKTTKAFLADKYGWKDEKFTFTYAPNRTATIYKYMVSVERRGRTFYGSVVKLNTANPTWGFRCGVETDSIWFNNDGSVDYILSENVQAPSDEKSWKHRGKCRKIWQDTFKEKLERAFIEGEYCGFDDDEPGWDRRESLSVKFKMPPQEN